MYHAAYERGGAAVVDALPGGRGWREAVEAYPETERHLGSTRGIWSRPTLATSRTSPTSSR